VLCRGRYRLDGRYIPHPRLVSLRPAQHPRQGVSTSSRRLIPCRSATIASGASVSGSCVWKDFFFPDALVPSYLLLSMSPASSPLSLLTSYWSRCIVQLVTLCHLERCGNNLTKLVDHLGVSYWLSSAVLASSSTSYFSHHTCYHLCCQHPHRHCTRRVILYNFPLTVHLRAALTIS
jgi:hypothetical protein